MTSESVNRVAECIFLAARTESKVGDAIKLDEQTITKKGSKQVKREIIEFAVEVLQSVGRDLPPSEWVKAKLVDDKIKSLEKMKWEES